MKLASIYLFSMIEIVKAVSIALLRKPKNSVVMIGAADYNTIIIIALYMAINSEAHHALQTELGKTGSDVLNFWNEIFDVIVLRNQELSEHESIDIAALLKRVSNENQRDDS